MFYERVKIIFPKTIFKKLIFRKKTQITCNSDFFLNRNLHILPFYFVGQYNVRDKIFIPKIGGFSFLLFCVFIFFKQGGNKISKIVN